MFEASFTATLPPASALIKIKTQYIPSAKLLEYEDKEKFALFCRDCPDYEKSWSCPPYSPPYSRYAQKHAHGLLVLFFSPLDQFQDIDENQRMRESNTFLRLSLEKSVRRLEKAHQGRMLSSGICRLCQNCTCKDRSGSCRRPQEMRYSMESLGLNVAKISELFLDHPLLWKTDGSLPVYCSALACLLTGHPVDEKEIAYVL